MADLNHLRVAQRKLLDNGMLIEAGWLGLRIAAVPLDAPAIQLENMRNAFFAGARHLMTTILNIMDDDRGPTDDDLHRMDQIEAELDAFIAAFELKHARPEGNA